MGNSRMDERSTRNGMLPLQHEQFNRQAVKERRRRFLQSAALSKLHSVWNLSSSDMTHIFFSFRVYFADFLPFYEFFPFIYFNNHRTFLPLLAPSHSLSLSFPLCRSHISFHCYFFRLATSGFHLSLKQTKKPQAFRKIVFESCFNYTFPIAATTEPVIAEKRKRTRSDDERLESACWKEFAKCYVNI